MPASYTKKAGSSGGKAKYAPDPGRFVFNVDTLWYTYDAWNYDEVMASGLMQTLLEGKELAEEGNPEFTQVKLDAYEYPATFQIEAGGQRPIYAYQVRNQDMAIFFAKKRRNDGTFPIKVQINQFKLWELGARDAFLESLEVLTGMGFAYENSKPNRIDLCVHSDQFQWTLDDLSGMDYPRNVADDNKPDVLRIDPDTRIFETAYFGDRTRLQLRIYNKSVEIKKKGKDYFNQIYLDKGMNPDKVWNVEFEVHRDWLKGLANHETGEENVFDSMDFLLHLDGLSMLWSHLVGSKFVHKSAFWKILQKGDPYQFAECRDHLFRLKDIDTTKKREVAQIRGRLQKLILDTEDLPEDADLMVEAMKVFQVMFHEYEEDKKKNFEEDVLKKRRLYMDTQLLKKEMAGKRKRFNVIESILNLQARPKLDNVEKVMGADQAALLQRKEPKTETIIPEVEPLKMAEEERQMLLMGRQPDGVQTEESIWDAYTKLDPAERLELEYNVFPDGLPGWFATKKFKFDRQEFAKNKNPKKRVAVEIEPNKDVQLGFEFTKEKAL
jgi:hypothetical protein